MSKIVICCFGITRSLRHTIKSIRRNVIEPAGDAPVFCHFFEQNQAIAVSGQTEGRVDVADAALLSPHWIETEAPGACLAQWKFDEICSYGDFWDNNFISLRNLIHQLHSLHQVTQAALKAEADVVIFCRPDLKYHDSLAPVLRMAGERDGQQDAVFLPSWQAWGGYNDRFAVARGSTAIKAYGQRITQVLDYCQATGSALQSERLVKHVLTQQDINVRLIPNRASRVRASGFSVWESFGDERANFRHERFKSGLWTLLNKSGLKPTARRVARFMHPQR